MSEVVKKYYDNRASEEWNRLVQDGYHQLEFIVTKHFLEKYLPKKGLILDAGGGPGRYSIELARKGYGVVLFDLSPRCLEVAALQIERAGVRGKVRSIVKGSITDLSTFVDGTFDAVLCLGAMSHLIQRKDRESAASELVRVAKENAPTFISVISLYGVFRTVLQRLPHEFLKTSQREMFSDGVHRAKWHRNEAEKSFPDAYFFRPADLRELFESHGLTTLEMATCEGLSSQLQNETNKICEDRRKWKFWLDILLKTCSDPAIIGLGEHFLYVGKKENRK